MANFNDAIDRISTKVNQLFRVGKVTAQRPDIHKVKVSVDDTCGTPLVTDWLPVLTSRACGDMEYDLPNIGSFVLVVFLPTGLESGFVLGSLYAQADGLTPPVSNANMWHKKFQDGSFLQYDRASHILTAHVQGDVIVNATGNADVTIQGKMDATVTGDVNITSAAATTIKASNSITLNAPTVNIQGVLNNTSQSGGAGTANVTGNVNVTGDVKAGAISLQSHVHGGVESGSKNTGAPQ